MTAHDALLAPIKGADSRQVGGVQLDILPAGDARVKRTIYPAGFRWATDMKPVSGTRLALSDKCERNTVSRDPGPRRSRP